MDRDLEARYEARTLVQRAAEAQKTLCEFSQEQIDRICAAVCEAGLQHAERLAELAVEETGFGNRKDKTAKNRFACARVWEAVQDQRTIGILREDPERGTMDVGVPVGVIAAIVPSTNPTSTVFYKTIIALKGGNAIVFSPHPNAAKCTLEAARIASQAAEAAGCPAGAVGCIETVCMEATNELMQHPLTRLILATGGPGMVRAAYSSGKPAIGVGAGNGPCYIHTSADLKQAVRDLITSKTFDNGTVCASEQSIVVEEANADEVKRELLAQGAHILSSDEAAKVAAILMRPNGTISPRVVGRTAFEIARMAGFTVPERTTVLVARETEAGPTRPYSREKLCPVLALFVLKNEDEVLQKAIEVLENEGSGHTFVMHCREDRVIRRFAQKIPVSRFLVNTPAALGGIGATTNLFPALTLGCGAVGGSSSSNNIGPLDLIDIRRVALGVRQMETPAAAQTVQVDDALIARLAEQIMKKLK